jgi:uncharacterized protein YabE (DUF348 family)
VLRACGPEEIYLWRIVRSKLALLTKSKTALAVVVAAVALAVVATTAGYAAMNKTVTLSVDGKASQVSTLGKTVGDVLKSEGIKLAEHDSVAPDLQAEVNEGTRIAVRYGRQLQVSVDGADKTYWVTATDVDGALDQLGLRFAGAELSLSRGATLPRTGLDLSVVTPKSIKVKVGAQKVSKEQIPALTVGEALDELGVKVDKDDLVQPKAGADLEDGDRIVVTKVRKVTRKVNEAVGFDTVERENADMFEGRSETVREGRAGTRHVTYKLRFENGELVRRRALDSALARKPVHEIVEVGTKERPEPSEPAPSTSSGANFAGGSTVWDQLAQCESGGNWAINTGNGYYGGLQFSLSTWRAYGGPGYPHQQSRETQIAIATKVRDANGGYGSWPHCSQQMGLPQ